jgi:hypothetical protein
MEKRAGESLLIKKGAFVGRHKYGRGQEGFIIFCNGYTGELRKVARK